ncbi:MAG: TMEM199/VMA12 family protein [Planctomycetota bacterium]|jgi:hypothetical protein
MVWLYSIVGVVAVLVLLFIWLGAYLKRKNMQAWRVVTIDDIEPLVQECIGAFREKLGLELDLNDLKGSTTTLDENIHTPKLREAFAKKGLSEYFALPVSAFVGDLILQHRKAGWQEEEDGSLSIWIQDGEEEKTVRPFEMVYGQAFAKQGTVFACLFTDVYPLEETAEPENVAPNVQFDSYSAETLPLAKETRKHPDNEILILKSQVESGANWFLWIAGLSLVNSFLILANIEWGFFFGLGITQVIDAIALEVGGDGNYIARIVAFAFDVIAASIFALFGLLSKKGRCWAFVVGMVLYVLDAMLFLVAKDFFGLAFHGFAFYCIINGYKSSRMLRDRTEGRSVDPNTSLQPVAVSPDANQPQDRVRKEVVWPIVITIISLVYAILYTLANIRALSTPWRLAICLSLFGGVLGVALKKKIGVVVLLAGSSVLILRMVYGIVSTVITVDKPLSVPEIIVLVVIGCIFIGWPVFLIIWFLRRPIRTHVKNEWT